jgi:GT2 family glycosyltransferase
MGAISPSVLMRTPRISVCVANYNGEHLLHDCLDSILAQRCNASVEILVHDDASTDASVHVLESDYPLVKVLCSANNVGFCAANHRMIEQATGDYVLLLNNDAALSPDALQALLDASALQQTPGILTLAQHDWESGDLVDRGCLLDPFYNPVPNLDPTRADVAMVIGACMWMPHALWTHLGGFPIWFDSIAEDMHICCRARLEGYPVQVAPTGSYRHRQGHSFGGNRAQSQGLVTTLRRRRLSERNKTYVMVICTPPGLLWAVLPLHAIALCFEFLFLGAKRRDSALWTAVYGHALHSLWSERHRLRAARQEAQKGRIITTRRYVCAFTPRLRKLELLIRHGAPTITRH